MRSPATQLLTLEDVAGELQVTPRQLRRLCQGRDPLPVFRLSRRCACAAGQTSKPGSRGNCTDYRKPIHPSHDGFGTPSAADSPPA